MLIHKSLTKENVRRLLILTYIMAQLTRERERNYRERMRQTHRDKHSQKDRQ